MNNLIKNFSSNTIFLMHKYYVFTLFIAFKILSLIFLFLVNKSLNEEFIYFFIVLFVIFVFWRFFTDLIDSFLNSRTELITAQYNLIFAKKMENLVNLINFFNENKEYYLDLKKKLEKLFSKLYFFLNFLGRIFLLNFLWLIFFVFFSSKFFNFVKSFKFFFDNYLHSNLLIKFREDFVNLLYSILSVFIFFEKDKHLFK